MKKEKLKLDFSKETIANLQMDEIKGGIFNTKIWCGSRRCAPDPPDTITQSELPDRCCDNETYNTCNCSKG